MQGMPTQEDYFTVYVSAVEHMGHFWVQVIGPKAGALDLEIQRMTEYYSEEGNRQVGLESHFYLSLSGCC